MKDIDSTAKETAIELAFSFADNEMRCELIDNEPWFVAKDICDILELTDVSKSMQAIDEDDKLIRIILVSGQNREMWLINEAGLYTLIFKSRKEKAKQFQKWVTKEVLPSIRKTGQYSVKEASYGFPTIESKAAVEYAFALKDLETAITLFHNITIDPKGYPVAKASLQKLTVAKNTFEKLAPSIFFTDDDQRFVVSNLIKHEVQAAVNATLPAKYKKTEELK